VRSWLDIERLPPRRRGSVGVVEIALLGPLTMMTVAEQELVILEAMTDRPADVLIDLTDVTEVSPIGLRMLDYLRARLAGHRLTLVLVADHPVLILRLEQSGLGALVGIFPTRDAAREALRTSHATER
jgi:anti-anti-sigma factor